MSILHKIMARLPTVCITPEELLEAVRDGRVVIAKSDHGVLVRRIVTFDPLKDTNGEMTSGSTVI